ncbi:hypothetical protein [Phaeovulum sp. W22_SRMD_FR3]|uniref:hypothetical protein n=1 Tax=Phaeovulum sp. W22_SRMD_FR3 TaxID=3240274 RepID=UPI003F97EE32
MQIALRPLLLAIFIAAAVGALTGYRYDGTANPEYTPGMHGLVALSGMLGAAIGTLFGFPLMLFPVRRFAVLRDIGIVMGILVFAGLVGGLILGPMGPMMGLMAAVIFPLHDPVVGLAYGAAIATVLWLAHRTRQDPR